MQWQWVGSQPIQARSLPVPFHSCSPFTIPVTLDGVAVGRQLDPQPPPATNSNARPLLPVKLPIAYSYIDIWLGGAVELQNRLVSLPRLRGLHSLLGVGQM